MPKEESMPGRDHRDLRAAILKRAASDLEFRQGLLADPRSAIESGFGVELPDGYRIRFVERDPDVDALVVLPDFEGSGGLSDKDLEAVAGGTGQDTDGDLWW